MSIQIEMIGTGSAFAKLYYNNNALVYANGYTLLIDCGITAPMALYKMGKPFDQIDGILVTHIHGDHVGGLEEFAFQCKFVYGIKPTLYIPDSLIEPLWETTLKGGMRQDDHNSLESYFNVVPIAANTPFTIHEGLKVEALQTPHIPNKVSFSFILNDMLFYSADMQFYPELLDDLVKNRGIRHILHDCQLIAPGVVHASLEQLLTLPDFIQEIVYLMHYGDTMEQNVGHTGKMRFIRQQEVYTFA